MILERKRQRERGGGGGEGEEAEGEAGWHESGGGGGRVAGQERVAANGAGAGAVPPFSRHRRLQLDQQLGHPRHGHWLVRGGEQRQRQRRSKQSGKTTLRGLSRLALALAWGVARPDYGAATCSGVTERPCEGLLEAGEGREAAGRCGSRQLLLK